ncbi:MAG: hypothetical protein C4523_21315 [Myxococcales bacterium]|nr:MAG: hypothetical protein C4523_21315 [Myxococcales bacterium]
MGHQGLSGRNRIRCFLAGLFCVLLASTAVAQEEVATTTSSRVTQDLGFKIGRLRLHPGFSLQNVYDSNVTNASSRYDPQSPTDPQIVQDYVMHLVGALRLEFPDDAISISLDGSAGYVRYFGLDNGSTTDLSALTGRVELAINLFKDAIVSFQLLDSFTRSVQPQQVGLVFTNDRIYNLASGRLGFKPGGGQLRFFTGYSFEFERYDDPDQANLNWRQHNVFLQWELEFLPKTAFFMASSLGFRSYYDFDPARDEFATNAEAPDAMPFAVSAGVAGRISSKVLINISVGYGNSFSENYEDYSSVVAKAEITGQFTPRAFLKGGFERAYAVIPTYSYTAENKIYLEYQQYLLRETLRLYLYGAFSYIQFGPADQGVDTDLRPNEVARIGDRHDMLWTLTPSLQYYILAWFNIEGGYTLTWRDTDYFIRRVNLDGEQSFTYYDYLKHEVFLKLTLSY